jgi:hypothetical protein
MSFLQMLLMFGSCVVVVYCRALLTFFRLKQVLASLPSSGMLFINRFHYIIGARCSIVGCGTVPQAGRSRVRFPVRS